MIPTELPDSSSDLIISSNADCEKINLSGYRTITVYANLCNSMKGDIVISNNNNLQSILIKMNSFTNVQSLTISNNINLVSIRVEGGSGWDGAFLYIKYFTLSSYPSIS